MIDLTQTAHSRRPPAFVAVVGDANSPVPFSGVSYYFLDAAKRAGLVDQGLNFSVDGVYWKARRMTWNSRQCVMGNRPGGYQHSEEFLDALWRQTAERLSNSIVINCGQLYPQRITDDRSVQKWFFIDQTLTQYYEHYKAKVGERLARDAIERERRGYEAAKGVIVQSNWAAGSVRNDYGISEERIHVAVPGANFDIATYRQWEKSHRPQQIRWRDGLPMKLAFVGKDWQRKGLDRLLGAVQILTEQHMPIKLRVIGCQQADLPIALRRTPNVEWFGFIDKRNDQLGYLNLISECDIGCLLSRAEAGGIALREYQSLGMAAFGTDAGGIIDHCIKGGSFHITAKASSEQVAARLAEVYETPEKLSAMRSHAWQNRESALWDETIRQMRKFWPHPAEPLASKAPNPQPPPRTEPHSNPNLT